MARIFAFWLITFSATVDLRPFIPLSTTVFEQLPFVAVHCASRRGDNFLVLSELGLRLTRCDER